MKARCLVCHDHAQVAEHHEWRRLDRDRKPRAVLCLNSPYVAKLVWPWMTHTAGASACDALEFEISPSAGEPCWCDCCTQHMNEAKLDPNDATARQKFAERSVTRFKDETITYANAIRPGIKVFFT